ncbi:hypothetical protein HOD29_04410 [archaeon]|jgi:hypothetical protein|nr:hypothetical protein [archaeon]
MIDTPKIGLDKNRLPNEEGVYLAKRIWGSETPREIDVYLHPIKQLSCFSEDFGSAGTGVDDKTDCHVSIQNTGLEFITKIRNFKK